MFPGLVPSFLVMQLIQNMQNLMFQCQEHLSTRILILTISMICKKSQQWVLHPAAGDHVVVFYPSKTSRTVGQIVFIVLSMLSNTIL